MVDLLVLVNAIQQWLFVPLIVVISVHSLWRFCRNVKQSAGQFVVRVQEALDHERQRLIEDIKADLLKTLNKGAESGHQQQVDKYKEKCNSTFEFSRGSGRLDRKDKTNIVNEIIYQIQSGGADSNRNCTDDDKVVETGGRIGEDSAILKDVHRRNVVARMKNLFESNESSKWHLNQVVDIINQKRISSTSMENLRTKTLAIPKASSEPPVVRLRRKIRSQQSLSESSIASSIEDILEAERFSKRLSQYSISEYLDESSPTSTPPAQAFNRISQNHKTLSTFSLSELLHDDEPDNLFAGVTLRRPLNPRRPAVVETIDQILADENLSRCYSQYSISDLVDDEVVFLQDNPPLIQCDSFA
uniref:Uncharacterized protein n=1 Tax=Culex tarsalis TaxID=7177 RepID=A0A1Q3EW36_CULTA